MSEELKPLAELVKQDDELTLGGEGEGKKIVLRRSELNVLRRMADRIPVTGSDREQALALTMEVIRGDHPMNQKMTALKCFTTFERLNIEELKLYVSTKLNVSESAKGTGDATTVNVNIIEQVIVKAQPGEEHLAGPSVAIVKEVLVNGRNGDHH